MRILSLFENTNNVLYHGTTSTEKFRRIIRDGLQGQEEQGKAALAPIKGRVYLTPSLVYGIIYAVGGNVLGHKMPPQFLQSGGRFGYLFEIDPNDLSKDVWPDEDVVGEAVVAAVEILEKGLSSQKYSGLGQEIAQNSDLVRRLARLFDIYTSHAPRLRRAALSGEYDAWARLGKKVLKQSGLNERTLRMLMDLPNVHRSHGGSVMPVRAWRIDRRLTDRLKPDGSNFFDLAKLVWERPKLQESFQHRAPFWINRDGRIVELDDPGMHHIVHVLDNHREYGIDTLMGTPFESYKKMQHEGYHQGEIDDELVTDSRPYAFMFKNGWVRVNVEPDAISVDGWTERDLARAARTLFNRGFSFNKLYYDVMDDSVDDQALVSRSGSLSGDKLDAFIKYGRIVESLTEIATEHPQFSRWFGQSKVVDEQGNPQPQYHGTIHDFEIFHPMSHFGTAGAASERLDLLSYPQIFKNWAHASDAEEFNKSRIIPVFLRIENPVWVEDDGSLADWEDFAKEAYQENIITDQQYYSLTKARHGQERLIELLQSMGYDGFGYDNAVEDYGSETWVPFDSSQIWPVFADRPLMEAQTKSGQDIEFNWNPNTRDRGGNPKWTIDLLEAFVDGEQVGYLSISYINPKKVFTNIFYFAALKGNIGAAPDDKPETHWSKWTREEKLASLKSDPRMPLWNKYVKDEEGKWVEDEEGKMIPLGTTLPDEKINELMKQAEEYLWKRLGDDYKRFLFHHTKPFVDYIRVNEDWQRQGIGLAMYQEAARYYAKQGRRFYASGLQSDQAQAAWEKMRQMGIVGKNKRGYYIMPSRLQKESLRETSEYPQVASADTVANMVVRLSGGDIDVNPGGIDEEIEKRIRRDIHSFSKYHLKWMKPRDIPSFQRGRNSEKVQQYIDMIQSGSMIPPIVISQPGNVRVKKNAIIDGNHRHEAALMAKLDKIPVYVGWKQDVVADEENPYYEEPVDVEDYDWIEGQGWVKNK